MNANNVRLITNPLNNIELRPPLKPTDPLTKALFVDPIEQGNSEACPHLNPTADLSTAPTLKRAGRIGYPLVFSPEPVAVFSDRPGFWLCNRCAQAHFHDWAWNTQLVEECDGCGQHTDTLSTAIVHHGPLTLVGLVCTECGEAVL